MTYSPTKLEQLRQFLQRIVTRSMDEVHTAWGADSRDCQIFKSMFVDGGGDRSHAAPTELVPVRVATKTAPQGEGASIPIYVKRRVLLELVFSIKVAMTYSPTTFAVPAAQS